MPLSLFNTLTRQKERFEPLVPGKVGLYVCGPTVYDYAHIGNARPVVVFDVLYRLLTRLYPDVRYVRNITDVDDKIIDRARENGEPMESVTARTAEAFHQDMAALNALPPDIEPRATAHIAQMVRMIERLVAAGNAYEADGHVLFAVPSMPDYGRLSRRSRDELIAGARVEVAPYKRDPADFVLWKPSPPEVPGWASPWGRGRPGWHIECSAMAETHLGETFDIHGGGLDLIFPHHENEIAQSVCAHGGAPLARYWVHNGFLTVEGEKMSKSLGNFFTVRDLLGEVPGEAIRLTLLGAHYRQPLDFTRDALRQSKATLDRWYGALRAVEDVPAAKDTAPPDELVTALEDDLNTPLAISHVHALVSSLNKSTETAERAALKGTLLAAGDLLGLLRRDPTEWSRGDAAAGGIDAAAIEDLIQRRKDARKGKDFAEADRIRKELADQGVILEDGPGGTTWKRA
ncbi:cysteinyl-tRNA synthetase [Skermanella stibiiresistens SB22]|uniref:Cysteine--tRNA ligase n=1 Tax=Skermanella stibiiresistens SB22 TaxID=1385369 RepID=W9H6X7_9PROT|nr:cysteine--tRNA ligase [Skermanella stibiiresistens]EWY41990.1 cysteinyl-tRNA synthetase [Skermanella stibiiresistens SB22]